MKVNFCVPLTAPEEQGNQCGGTEKVEFQVKSISLDDNIPESFLFEAFRGVNENSAFVAADFEKYLMLCVFISIGS